MKQLKALPENTQYLPLHDNGRVGANSDKIEYASLTKDEALAIAVRGLSLDARAQNENSDSAEAIKTYRSDFIFNGKNLGINVVKSNAKNKVVTGQAAAAAFKQVIKGEGVIKIPLWNSGFTIALSFISKSDLADLQLRIIANATELGRKTSGKALSHLTAGNYEIILDFITKYIFSSNFNVPIDQITDYIKVADLKDIIAGLLTSMYPLGFPMLRPCSNVAVEESGKISCSYVAETKADFSTMIVAKPTAVTTPMRRHMSKGKNTHSIEDILAYQGWLKHNAHKVVELQYDQDIIKMELAQPSATEYFEAYKSWIDRIEYEVDELYDIIDEKDRFTKMQTKAVARLIEILSHFIVSLVNADGAIVNDPQNISIALNAIVETDINMAERIISEIVKYRDNSTVTRFGINSFTCEKCGKSNGGFVDICPIRLGFHMIKAQADLYEKSVIALAQFI